MPFDKIIVTERTQEAIETAKLAQVALELRQRGLSFSEIGDHIGVSNQIAGKLVRKALDSFVVDGVEELRELESSRLDELLRSLWDRAKEGELQAVDRVLKIMERRAKLLGLDTPTKLDINAPKDTGPRIIEIGLSTAGETSGDVLALPSKSVELP